MYEILAQAASEITEVAGKNTLSPAAITTLVFMIVIIAGGLTWSFYRAMTASPKPDEKQYSGEV